MSTTNVCCRVRTVELGKANKNATTTAGAVAAGMPPPPGASSAAVKRK